MNHTAAQEASYTTEPALFMAIELSAKNWRLASSAGGDRLRQPVIPAWDKAALGRQIASARKRFGLAENTQVYACYEAGRVGMASRCIDGWRSRGWSTSLSMQRA